MSELKKMTYPDAELKSAVTALGTEPFSRRGALEAPVALWLSTGGWDALIADLEPLPQ